MTAVKPLRPCSPQTNGTYTFADVEDYETFSEEVYDMGLSEDYTVTSADVNSYEQSLVPLETLSTTAGYFLIVIVAIGVLILVVLNVFSIRERKYENRGSYRHWHEKIQGSFHLYYRNSHCYYRRGHHRQRSWRGGFRSRRQRPFRKPNYIPRANRRPISSKPLVREMPSFDGTIAEPPQEAEGNGISAVTEISAAVDGEILVKLLGICVVLAIASAAVSVGTIMRYQPLNILANRD